MNPASCIRFPVICLCTALLFGCGDEKPGAGGSGGPTVKRVSSPGSSSTTASNHADWKIVSVETEKKVADRLTVTLKGRKRRRQDGREVPLWVVVAKSAPPIQSKDSFKQSYGAPAGMVAYSPFDHLGNGSITFDVSKLGKGKHSFKLTIMDSKQQEHKKELKVEFTRGQSQLFTKVGIGVDVTCGGAQKCKGSFRDGRLTIHGAAGSKVKFGKQTGTLENDKFLKLKLDYWSYISGKSIAEIKALKLKIPFEISLPDGEKLTTVFEGRVVEPLAWGRGMLKWAKGGSKLPGEPAYRGKPRAMMHGSEFFGAPKHLHEVDLVTNGKSELDTKKCGTFKNSKGETRTYSLERERLTLAVHDRRTGRLLKKKKLKAEFSNCPKSITKLSGELPKRVKSAVVDAWYRKTFLKLAGK